MKRPEVDRIKLSASFHYDTENSGDVLELCEYLEQLEATIFDVAALTANAQGFVTLEPAQPKTKTRCEHLTWRGNYLTDKKMCLDCGEEFDA